MWKSVVVHKSLFYKPIAAVIEKAFGKIVYSVTNIIGLVGRWHDDIPLEGKLCVMCVKDVGLVSAGDRCISEYGKSKKKSW
jgi:hypothetical protein